MLKTTFNGDVIYIYFFQLQSSFYDYVEPLPVYQNEKIGALKEGISFTVTGSILLNCER